MNNRTRWISAVLVAMVFGAVLGYGFARLSPAADTQMSRESEGRKVLYWHDPMAPGVKFDKPGKSPFMDMQLVPVYADEGADSDVRIAPAVSQNLGIRLGSVERRVVSQQVDTVGSVAFDERLLEVVQARVEGYVTRLYVQAPLTRVRRGQPLAEIQAPAWLAAQQDYIALLESTSESAQPIRNAARERLVVLGVPEATIRALEKDRRAKSTTTVFAPIDGVLSDLNVRAGAAFMPGAPLFRINGLSTVWVNAQVPESQVSLVSTGSTVQATATAWPDTTFKGQVIALLPEIDPQTRTLAVRIGVENPQARLSPGMFVSLSFEKAKPKPQLVVPSEAVIVTGERSVVIVAREGGGFDVTEVQIGTESDGMTVIHGGLQEGQSIVLSGQFLLDSEASLTSAVDRLTNEPPAMDMGARDENTPASSHTTQGIVKAISPTDITIAHEPVSSIEWGAMTMAFQLPADGLPEDIKVGSEVRFSFSTAASGGFQIDSIARKVQP